MVGAVAEEARKGEKRKETFLAEIKVVRVAEHPAQFGPLVSTPEAAVQAYKTLVQASEWFDPEKESFVVFILDRKNRLKGFNLVSLGTATSSLVHPREVFRPAIALSGAAILALHNHPSGDPAPSSADIQVTRQLRQAGTVLEIDLLDHVIVGNPACDPTGRGFYSSREAGLI